MSADGLSPSEDRAVRLALEVARLRATVASLRAERDELLAQIESARNTCSRSPLCIPYFFDDDDDEATP